MGFWSRFLGIDSYDAAQRVLPEPFEPFMSTGGIPVMDPGSPLDWWIDGGRREDHFWRTQPNLRKVIDFIARNVASVPLNAYERRSDTERIRITGEPLSDVLRSPLPRVSGFRFWHGVLSDALLYDRWAAVVMPTAAGGLNLMQIPSWRLFFQTDAMRQVVGIWYWTGTFESDGEWTELPIDELVFDHGYAPQHAGMSPVETLRDVLDESAEAVRWRRQVWENGGRFPGYVSRPPESQGGAKWTPEQRDRFVTQMRAAYGKDGPKAGGLPLLEDGMKIESVDVFSPQDAHDLEGRQLTAVEVAAAFHIAPELVGARQGNYSNVREYRQMLYRDSLGPYISAVEGTLNAQLIPMLDDARPLYIEANVEAKLRGSFEERAAVMSTAVGGPWMSRNEARALDNRPPVPGGDELIVPLNVLVGGQASVRDTGSQNREPKSKAAVPAIKAVPTDAQRRKVAEVLDAFFDRQGKSVLSAIGAGGDWWDEKRWNDELATDLAQVAHTLAAIMGPVAAQAMGYTADDYDPDMTVHFLRAVAADRASGINATTREQLQEAVDAGDDGDPSQVFNTARNARTPVAAHSLATFAAGFATVEAARQIGKAHGVKTTKTWVTGPNPRPTHAAMDGETVGIDEKFSNGMEHPGQGGADDAGCNCTVTISQEAP